MAEYADEIKSNLAQTVIELRSARQSLAQGQYDAAASHASRAALHTASALLLNEGIEPGQHGEILSLIQQVFVDRRRLTQEQGEKLSWLFQLGKRDSSAEGAPLILGEAQKAVEFAESFFESAKVILES